MVVVVAVIVKIITTIKLMGFMFIRLWLCSPGTAYIFIKYLSSLLKASEVGAISCLFYR